MRRDMYKKLVERARPGGHGARKGRPTRDFEDAPARQGFRKAAIATGDPKSLSENLAPLRRYLAGQINRPWNKVQSEMRATVDVRNPVQAHLFAHVDWILHTVVTKVPPSAGASCGLMYQDPARCHGLVQVRINDLYVDPDDGIIKRARRRKTSSQQSDPTKATKALRGPRVRRLSNTGPELCRLS